MKESLQKIINVLDKDGEARQAVMYPVATLQGLGFVEEKLESNAVGSEDQEALVYFPRWLKREPVFISLEEISPCNTY